ncbi:MAG TPA: hypothetical protein PLT35_13285 [Vicinamibacterales bacterium]|nr:hypothetical protein [Vicinamibacterales bacterium]
MHASDLADLAATSLSRLASDLRAAADPACTSTREAIASTLAQDRADAVRDLRKLAMALRKGSGDRALATRLASGMVLGHPVSLDALVASNAAAYWRSVRDRLDAA